MRARLLIQILPLVALAVAALTAVAVKVASDHQRTAIYGEIQQRIGREAEHFEAGASAHDAVAHDLAAAVEGDPRHDRAPSAGVVTQTGRLHPDIFGTWVAYEPNRFDGRDARYQGADRSATTTAASPSGPAAPTAGLRGPSSTTTRRRCPGRRRTTTASRCTPTGTSSSSPTWTPER